LRSEPAPAVVGLQCWLNTNGLVVGTMNTSRWSLIFCAVVSAAGLVVGAANASAQDRPPQGGFDPQRMQQMLMDRVRQQLEVKDDAEWKAISNRVAAVVAARRSLGLGGGGPMGPPPGGRGFGPGGPGGQDAGVRPQEGSGGPGAGGPPPGGFGGAGGGPGGGGVGMMNRESGPEMESLRKAVDGKAPNSELKAKIAELNEARKRKQEDLAKAQDDLRQVLSVRQEAIASTLGLL